MPTALDALLLPLPADSGYSVPANMSTDLLTLLADDMFFWAFNTTNLQTASGCSIEQYRGAAYNVSSFCQQVSQSATNTRLSFSWGVSVERESSLSVERVVTPPACLGGDFTAQAHGNASIDMSSSPASEPTCKHMRGHDHKLGECHACGSPVCRDHHHCSPGPVTHSWCVPGPVHIQDVPRGEAGRSAGLPGACSQPALWGKGSKVAVAG